MKIEKKKTQNQTDEVGFKEGYHTGQAQGYSKAVLDSLLVIKDLLQENDIRLDDKEFYIQFRLMIEEGKVTPPEGVRV